MKDDLFSAVKVAVQLLDQEGLGTRGQKARQLLRDALVRFKDAEAAEQSEEVTGSLGNTELNAGQLK